METAMVSPKFQVVIPRSVRDALDIRPGERMQVLQYKDRIEFVPLKEMKKARGFLKGIDTTVVREKDIDQRHNPRHRTRSQIRDLYDAILRIFLTLRKW